MFTDTQIWRAIDMLAQRKGWSLSGLAVRAGLDPTALNPSKRVGVGGKRRWPSSETIAKLLTATGIELSLFCRLVERQRDEQASAGDDGIADSVSGGRVLLLDEDSLFRDDSATLLRQAGYEVNTTGDHRIALDFIAGGNVDVLCTAIEMIDGLGGLALARRARESCASLRILFVTSLDIPGFAVRAEAPILHKPVASADLLTQIAWLMQASRSSGPRPSRRPPAI